MPKTLAAAGNRTRLIAPTTTTKLAMRMIRTFEVLSATLPAGLNSPVVLDILLTLHLAEEDARYPEAAELAPSSSPCPKVTARWVDMLVRQGLLDRRDDLLALSVAGHNMVVNILERIYAAQRLLD